MARWVSRPRRALRCIARDDSPGASRVPRDGPDVCQVFLRRRPVVLPGKLAWTDGDGDAHTALASAPLACLTHPHALHEEDEARSAAQRRQDQLPRQQQRVRIGTDEVPLGAEELYYNQLSWAY